MFNKQSLPQDDGADSNVTASMIISAIDKYRIDPKRVLVTDSSSGGELL
jgi:acetylxylan esterase